MKKVYIIRHGQSIWNEQHIWAGKNADIPLSDFGRQEAREACSTLCKYDFTNVCSSSLIRARETASIIAEELGIELLEPITDLDDRDYGIISGLTYEQIKEQYPNFMKDWWEGKPTEIPGSEDWQEFVNRVEKGLNCLTSVPGNLLIVSHVTVLRAIEFLLDKNLSRHNNLEGIWLKGNISHRELRGHEET